ANGAQSSRVPVLLPDDPYVVVRQAQLVDTDIESDLEEAPLEVEESQPLGSRVPLLSEEFEAFEPSGNRTVSSYSLVSTDSTAPLSPDHPLTHASPIPTPTRVLFHRRTARMAMHTQLTLSPSMSARIAEAAALSLSSFRKRYRSSYETPSPSSSPTLPVRKRYKGTYELILDTDSEGDELGEEDTKKDESNESQGLEGEGLSLEEEEVAPEDQQQAVLASRRFCVVNTVVSEPLGLGYGEARRRALESIEEIAPSTYEVEQSSRSVPKPKGAERISAFRQSTLVTWVDPENNRVYTDVRAYAPPTAPLELHGSILHDHTQRLDALPPTLVADIDRDVRELYTRSGVSLWRLVLTTAVTFGALWRPVLALEAWAGNAVMQRELQEMGGHVVALEQERGRKEP
ncbi:hypothetical protein Tco_1084363, partial [Tanacetum coccineum]